MKFNLIAKTAEKFVTDNSPSILAGVAVAGTISTALLAARAGYWSGYNTAMRHADDETPEWSDIVKSEWRMYIPAATSGIATVAAIVTANHIGNRRAAAVAAAYSITERAFTEYKDKVTETLGERKEEKIRDSIAQDRVTRNPPDSQILITGGADSVVVYEAFTGRYFAGSMETLRKAQNDLNAEIVNNYYSSLSDFYDFVGWPRTSYSDDVGWNSDKLLELRFSAVLDDGKPVLSMEYSVVPVRNYSNVN